MGEFKFGDLVRYDLRASHGGDVEEAFVIGEPFYSENGSHIVLADHLEVGMPINAGHCTLVSAGHTDQCQAFLDRWRAKFPSWKLKADMTKVEIDAACMKAFGKTHP